MSVHLKREIDHLKQMLLEQCSRVEEHLWKSVRAVETWDGTLARQVIDRDTEIDRKEVDIEEECLKMLALYQPVAIDLRYIITALKINNDLERIGDLAVNIAERAEYLSAHEQIEIPSDLERMAVNSQAMVRQSIDALVNLDCSTAHRVCQSDDEVDALHKSMYEHIQERIRRRPEQMESLMHLLSVSRHLERIADHATNIAEDVIYLVEGHIIRHKKQDPR
ncbi:MAG TPA: phosphate signaling complex protein PhoU [Anaerohalosphaeraceae bacterium]|nr:phosphate signaling complex protein PhoU [Anaerohalosphaeraceae bacterium]HOL87942.1 phosphate signaling complex protein PhoU [Anaerohalosphaeraceae bacterium]HOQ04764.1 phosphate signaling complex protein PhoU [Anaerohalosphaeraceae bacterium]HPP55441.1 phosphate signaling complex protein PhoU [Anaerohalosphaeraceae bacterium]